MVSTVQNKLLIMDFNNENIGYVERAARKFILCLDNEIREFTSLPAILCGIAPEPTQFPAANDVLEYYNMDKPDVWTYLARSNGLKGSRNVWFMAEPGREVWIPLISGMQRRYTTYKSLFCVGDEVRVLMNGKAYINRHTLDILPPCIAAYLTRYEDTRFSAVSGYVKELSPYTSVKGLIGRIVLDFGGRHESS